MELSDEILRFNLNEENSLLINPLSGAIDLIPNKYFAELPGTEKEKLIERGYFIAEKERAEKLSHLQSINISHNKNVPYWFYILTTLNCNFKCPICYERNTLTNSELSTDTLEQIVKSVAKFQKQYNIPDNRINLLMFGGEPLCTSNKSIIHQILEESSKSTGKI